jgi:hypothetical protein
MVFFQKKQDGTEYTKRLVMDKKFYSDGLLRKIAGIPKIINDLYHKKDYSERKRNNVFMFHPANSKSGSYSALNQS